ncbi:MAG: hypothetical protein IKP95_09195 [Ruminococcus sp.]|nr:hypothetical protein [Ruminococcus sp.]
MNKKPRGTDHFSFNGKEINMQLQDFWAFYASDILESSIRGAIAEFIVKSALNSISELPPWYPFDVLYKTFKIEVKSSSYVHNETTESLTKPVFRIEKKQLYIADTKWTKPARHSDFYIFCLLACKDIDKANPMCLEQWEFYIVSTKYLDEHFNNAKTINLSRVQAISKKADYNNLKDVLNEYILETVDLCNGGENNSDLEETI